MYYTYKHTTCMSINNTISRSSFVIQFSLDIEGVLSIHKRKLNARLSENCMKTNNYPSFTTTATIQAYTCMYIPSTLVLIYAFVSD